MHRRWSLQMTLAGAIFVLALLLGLMVPPLLHMALQALGRPDRIPASSPAPVRGPSTTAPPYRVA